VTDVAAEPGAPARYSAQFLDGWSLAAVDVHVELFSSGVRVLDSTGREHGLWTATGLRCDAMQEGGVMHVTHGSAPQETLVVRDAALAERLVAICENVTALPGGRHRVRFAFLCIAALVALGTLAYLAMPQIAHFIAVRIPLEHERALGSRVEAVLDLAGCDSGPAHEALQKIEQRLLGPDTRQIFEVRLMKAEEPNAFALPGGVIVVTTGFLEEAESSDEVAGVLAHEIEHVVQRHVLTGLIRDALLSGLWAVSVGDYSGLLVVDPTTAYRVANLQFSRGDETAADRGAVSRLHQAGLSHRGMLAFFERRQSALGIDGPSWLSTHPATSDRIASLRAAQDVRDPQPALSSAEFDALKSGCEPKK
jgi:predicted Zn-dependent protease